MQAHLDRRDLILTSAIGTVTTWPSQMNHAAVRTERRFMHRFRQRRMRAHDARKVLGAGAKFHRDNRLRYQFGRIRSNTNEHSARRLTLHRKSL